MPDITSVTMAGEAPDEISVTGSLIPQNTPPTINVLVSFNGQTMRDIFKENSFGESTFNVLKDPNSFLFSYSSPRNLVSLEHTYGYRDGGAGGGAPFFKLKLIDPEVEFENKVVKFAASQESVVDAVFSLEDRTKEALRDSAYSEWLETKTKEKTDAAWDQAAPGLGINPDYAAAGPDPAQPILENQFIREAWAPDAAGQTAWVNRKRLRTWNDYSDGDYVFDPTSDVTSKVYLIANKNSSVILHLGDAPSLFDTLSPPPGPIQVVDPGQYQIYLGFVDVTGPEAATEFTESVPNSGDKSLYTNITIRKHVWSAPNDLLYSEEQPSLLPQGYWHVTPDPDSHIIQQLEDEAAEEIFEQLEQEAATESGVIPTIYIAYGVGNDLNSWAGPFATTLMDADTSYDTKGVRTITLDLVAGTGPLGSGRREGAFGLNFGSRIHVGQEVGWAGFDSDSGETLVDFNAFGQGEIRETSAEELDEIADMYEATYENGFASEWRSQHQNEEGELEDLLHITKHTVGDIHTILRSLLSKYVYETASTGGDIPLRNVIVLLPDMNQTLKELQRNILHDILITQSARSFPAGEGRHWEQIVAARAGVADNPDVRNQLMAGTNFQTVKGFKVLESLCAALGLNFEMTDRLSEMLDKISDQQLTTEGAGEDAQARLRIEAGVEMESWGYPAGGTPYPYETLPYGNARPPGFSPRSLNPIIPLLKHFPVNTERLNAGNFYDQTGPYTGAPLEDWPSALLEFFGKIPDSMLPQYAEQAVESGYTGSISSNTSRQKFEVSIVNEFNESFEDTLYRVLNTIEQNSDFNFTPTVIWEENLDVKELLEEYGIIQDKDKPVILVGSKSLIQGLIYGNIILQKVFQNEEAVTTFLDWLHPADIERFQHWEGKGAGAETPEGLILADSLGYSQTIFDYLYRPSSGGFDSLMGPTIVDDYETIQGLTVASIPIFRSGYFNSNILSMKMEIKPFYLNALSFNFLAEGGRTQYRGTGSPLAADRRSVDTVAGAGLTDEEQAQLNEILLNFDTISPEILTELNAHSKEEFGFIIQTRKDLADYISYVTALVDGRSSAIERVVSSESGVNSFHLLRRLIDNVAGQLLRGAIKTVPFFRLSSISSLMRPIIMHVQEARVIGSRSNVSHLSERFYSGFWSIQGFKHIITQREAFSEFTIFKNVGETNPVFSNVEEILDRNKNATIDATLEMQDEFQELNDEPSLLLRGGAHRLRTLFENDDIKDQLSIQFGITTPAQLDAILEGSTPFSEEEIIAAATESAGSQISFQDSLINAKQEKINSIITLMNQDPYTSLPGLESD